MVRKARLSAGRCARSPRLEDMLVLSRRADESILIQPAEGADGSMTLAQLFANGRRVKVGIEAPEQLAIRRKDAA